MQKILCIKGVDIQAYHVSYDKQEHSDIQFVVSAYGWIQQQFNEICSSLLSVKGSRSEQNLMWLWVFIPPEGL